MTEPKVVRHSCWCSNKELDPVEMVRYSDYARLAARVQELEAGVLLSEAGNRVLEVEADDLIAENKRLREALKYAVEADEHIFGAVQEKARAALEEKP